MPPVAALTIAGSDPSGGAGIQADLKTFHQFGVYGMAAITLLTVQNTQRVSQVQVMPPELVVDQVRAVLEDIPPQAVKLGALGNAGVIEALADLLSTITVPLIIDPVMVSKHGSLLMEQTAIRAFVQRLLPLSTLLTPNLPEAAVLTGQPVQSVQQMHEAARLLRCMGASNVLVKGGHLDGEPIDVLHTPDGVQEYPAQRVPTRNTHGTGCTYASAITACLAYRDTLPQAIGTAKLFLSRAIATNPGLGHGTGPVNHFAPVK